MEWSIVWTDQAARDLSKIDPSIARRIVRKLEQAADNPIRFFVRLVGSDEHKLRISDDRLLAALDPETRTIVVQRVDHRSRVYERRR